MGWTGLHKPKGQKVTEFFKNEFEQTFIPNEKTGFKVLEDTANFQAYFAILERKDCATGEEQKFVLIVLYQASKGNDYYNFHYKEIEESCGPYVIAPKSFMKKVEKYVPEAPSKYAKEWRQRCYDYYKKVEKAKNLEAGDKVEIYGKTYTLTLKRKGGHWLGKNQNGTLYRISRQKIAEAKVL